MTRVLTLLFQVSALLIFTLLCSCNNSSDKENSDKVKTSVNDDIGQNRDVFLLDDIERLLINYSQSDFDTKIKDLGYSFKEATKDNFGNTGNKYERAWSANGSSFVNHIYYYNGKNPKIVFITTGWDITLAYKKEAAEKKYRSTGQNSEGKTISYAFETDKFSLLLQDAVFPNTVTGVDGHSYTSILLKK